MRNFIIVFVLLLLSAISAKADDNWGTCSSIGFCGFRPSLPVFGSGPATNLGSGNTAVMNATMHIALATAIPLVGYKLGGSKGKWIAGLSWIALTLIQESFFHAPNTPGVAYASEVRTDLLTRIAPTLLVLSF